MQLTNSKHTTQTQCIAPGNCRVVERLLRTTFGPQSPRFFFCYEKRSFQRLFSCTKENLATTTLLPLLTTTKGCLASNFSSVFNQIPDWGADNLHWATRKVHWVKDFKANDDAVPFEIFLSRVWPFSIFKLRPSFFEISFQLLRLPGLLPSPFLFSVSNNFEILLQVDFFLWQKDSFRSISPHSHYARSRKFEQPNGYSLFEKTSIRHGLNESVWMHTKENAWRSTTSRFFAVFDNVKDVIVPIP